MNSVIHSPGNVTGAVRMPPEPTSSRSSQVTATLQGRGKDFNQDSIDDNDSGSLSDEDFISTVIEDSESDHSGDEPYLEASLNCIRFAHAERPESVEDEGDPARSGSGVTLDNPSESHPSDNTVEEVVSIVDDRLSNNTGNPSASISNGSRIVTRGLRRSQKRIVPAEDAHEESAPGTDVKRIKQVHVGRYCIDVPYQSAYAGKHGESSKLYVCDSCLKYTYSRSAFKKHAKECPPFKLLDEAIYRKGNIAIWEVDGQVDAVYCQNLCLLSMLFLEKKCVSYNVSPFVFYVLREVGDLESHFIGYFSKEKERTGNNLSCIFVLPPHQKQGYGKLLIDLSYQLSKFEGVAGTPERPLSVAGKPTYMSYWSWKLITLLRHKQYNLNINELSSLTSISEQDIMETFQAHGLLKLYKRKFSRKVRMNRVNAAEEKVKVPKFLIDMNILHEHLRRVGVRRHTRSSSKMTNSFTIGK